MPWSNSPWLRPTLMLPREAVKRMSTKHGGSGGAIVNVSSVAAVLGSAATGGDVSAEAGGAAVTSCPLIRIRPEVTSSNPASIMSRVVFPDPEGPSRLTNSPPAMSRSRPSTTLRLP